MHELSVATALLDTCREELRTRGGTRIESARVAVGELSGVEPDLLAHAWDAVLAGTPSAGARLDIEYVPVRQLCPDCGAIEDRQPGTWLRLCPTCAAPLRLEGGDELDLVELAFQTETRRPTTREVIR